MPEAEVTVTRRSAASTDELYALVSDVARMGEWSPENTGGRWIRGASGPVVGARFRGSNQRGWRRWTTNCTVVEAERGRRFAFEVAVVVVPASRWTYDFEPDGEGTIVSETWIDRRPRWLDVLAGATMGIDDIREHNRENMRLTLDRLASAAEKPG
jgi:hypothetical protein